MEIGNIQWIR